MKENSFVRVHMTRKMKDAATALAKQRLMKLPAYIRSLIAEDTGVNADIPLQRNGTSFSSGDGDRARELGAKGVAARVANAKLRQAALASKGDAASKESSRTASVTVSGTCDPKHTQMVSDGLSFFYLPK